MTKVKYFAVLSETKLFFHYARMTNAINILREKQRYLLHTVFFAFEGNRSECNRLNFCIFINSSDSSLQYHVSSCVMFDICQLPGM